MPGFPYSMKTGWDYTRYTNSGDFSANIEEERRNDHVLLSKLVWTDRQQYQGGERVNICAELVTLGANRPEDYYVMANCFPQSDQDNMRPRMLRPGNCRIKRPREWECFTSFPEEFLNTQLSFPFASGVYRFSGDGTPRLAPVTTDNQPQEALTLRIPLDGVRVDLLPTNKVAVIVSHTFLPVTVTAFDPIGRVVASDTGGQQQRHADTLVLEADLISHLVVAGGGGEGYLHGLCIEREKEIPHEEKLHRFQYTGLLDLGLREAADRWGVVLAVQTVDNSPPGTDPIVAAKNIAGIPTAATTAQLAGCVTVLLLDHVFDVI
jgi:hypothetical protein